MYVEELGLSGEDVDLFFLVVGIEVLDDGQEGHDDGLAHHSLIVVAGLDPVFPVQGRLDQCAFRDQFFLLGFHFSPPGFSRYDRPLRRFCVPVLVFYTGILLPAFSYRFSGSLAVRFLFPLPDSRGRLTSFPVLSAHFSSLVRNRSYCRISLPDQVITPGLIDPGLTAPGQSSSGS